MFALDIDSTGDVKTGENHQGKTTGSTDNERGLDFVQKMINHIIVPLRTSVNETNIKNTLPVYGYYGDMTKQALEAIINGGADPTGSALVDTKVSHHINEENSLNTFKKLVKDYSSLNETDIGKVIDKEILVGLNKSDTDIHPTKLNDEGKSDVGIYELYNEDDWDEDGISNYIEVENSTVFDKSGSITGSISFNPLQSDNASETKQLLRSFSRGSVGIRAKWNKDTNEFMYYTGFGPGNISTTQTEGDYSTVTISNGIRVPDTNKGYYYWRGGDAENSDNYSTLDKIQVVEAIGQEWVGKYPYYPLHENAFERKDNIDEFPEGNRFGVLDLSIPGGVARTDENYNSYESWNNKDWNDHSTHENGLDIDVRYMSRTLVEGDGRTVRRERKVDLNDPKTKDYYDQSLTLELMKLFVKYGAKLFYVDEKDRANINGPIVVGEKSAIVETVAGHSNHFHVNFERPYKPSGTIMFNQTWNDSKKVYEIISDTIKDSLGLSLLWNTALHIKARNEQGIDITDDVISIPDIWTGEGGYITDIRPTIEGNQIATDKDGKIKFEVKKPASGNKVTISINSIIGTASGTIEMDFTGK